MNRNEARELAKKLVGKMTVEEMASQLKFDSPAIERLNIPAYNWWNETLHGVARGGTATSFPQAIALAATFDPELLEKIGDACAIEARAKYNALSVEGDRDIYHGLTMWSPNVNIFRDPRWGRGHETYGEDPYLTAEMGKAFVRGLQGGGDTVKVAACAKHFAVHSGPEELRHHFDAIATEKDMEETYLPAFKALVQEAGVEAVMGAYNRTNGEPCCGSPKLMKKLRDDWGFEGHFVSDCWAVRDFHEGHKVTSEPVESVKLALETGCDVNCGCTYQHVMHAYELGMISKETIEKAAARLFTTRYMLGIMPGTGSEYDSIPYSEIESPEHLELSREAALKSAVLLENNGILPLNPATCGTIGVIGPNANSRAALVGNYHGTASRYVTILEGIQNYAGENGGGRVLYSEGCHLFKDRVEPLALPGDRLAEAVAVAKNSDTVILVVGLDETLEGEEGDTGNSYYSGDKKDLLLPEPQRKLIQKVLAVGKPTIVVLMAGSAIDISDFNELADAVLLSWYPGAAGGDAIADLLFGETSPSGKLPVTFYKNEALSEMPDFTDYSMENRTYRYYRGKPLYPFGYGLTYSDTEVLSFTYEENGGYGDASQGSSGADCGDTEIAGTARVRVKNSDDVGTGDVLQIYIHDEVSEFAPLNPSLCAFKRIYLNPGEEKELELPISATGFTVVDNEGNRISGSGEWSMYVGFCSPDCD